MNEIEKLQHLSILAEHRGLLYFIKEEHYNEFNEDFKELEDILTHLDILILMAASCQDEDANEVRKMFIDFENSLQLFTQKFDF